MNILLSAYACAPDVGGEPGIGWGIALELAKRHNVWVLTRSNNQPAHEGAFARTAKPPSLHFVYYDLPRWASFWKRGAKRWRLYYYVWQLAAVRTARQVARAQHIEACQHITIGMDHMPSGLAFAAKPFIWGPVGSEDIHPAILRALPLQDRLVEWLRIALRSAARTYDPFMYLTRRRATLILCFSSADSRSRSSYLRSVATKVRPAVQTGLNVGGPHPARTSQSPAHPFTVLFAGTLVHRKGAQLAADAFGRFAKTVTDARLVIIGDGPLRGRIERMIRDAGVKERVEFTGTVSMARLEEHLEAADVFLCPYYRHGLPTVCLQAMASGLPVVCLGDGVIAETVGSDCGVPVPLGESSLPEALAQALRCLYDDPELRFRLGSNARARVLSDYSYKAVVQRWEPVYRDLQQQERGAR